MRRYNVNKCRECIQERKWTWFDASRFSLTNTIWFINFLIKVQTSRNFVENLLIWLTKLWYPGVTALCKLINFRQTKRKIKELVFIFETKKASSQIKKMSNLHHNYRYLVEPLRSRKKYSLFALTISAYFFVAHEQYWRRLKFLLIAKVIIVSEKLDFRRLTQRFIIILNV